MSPDPRFERAVLGAFRAAVERYCTVVNAGDVDPGSLRISVTVATRTPMGRDFAGKVHRIVHPSTHRWLPLARVVSVVCTVDPSLPDDPGHRFLIQPPALPAPRQAPRQALPQTRIESQEVPLPPAQPPPETVHLTLRYGADFHWVCHLASAPGWVPLGRWTGSRHDASVRLPEYATFLPRGELVYLRHQGHRVEFARSRVRPTYLVRVDGTPLRANGRPIQAGPAGSIEYADGAASSTRLDYLLAWDGGRG
ncbi:hypothetical protein ACFQFC_34935 [Amorphoplanes digitatis]|uniref:Uncharacterized protein n=1 Tax=Actinoplanes digitatis TaxID=1868 RepID=A0A7W7MPB8_9ACTN|nr:hypothetical protein [Actinoplanes digitatis]MBB4761360.1 hypothetical protein [Actinoplanes digitatis]GID94594.1 hypothetical protein Adi01nite_40060 [Actinoplanes digitatis]